MSTPEPPPYPGESTPDSSGDLPSYGSVQPPPDAPDGGTYGSVPPPPPPPPPAPPSYGPQAFSAPDAVGWGWRKFTENIGPVLLAMLAVLGISMALGVLSAILTGGFRPQPMTPGTLEFSAQGPGELLANLIQWIGSTFLMGVAAKAALEVTEGQPFDFFGAFKKVNLVRLLIASVLVGIAILIGFVLLIIPGLIVMFLTYLTTYSLVDEDKSPIDAIKHSAKLVSSNLGDSILLAILNFLVIVAGFIALCVGLLAAFPVTIFATAYAYRSFNGQSVAP